MDQVSLRRLKIALIAPVLLLTTLYVASIVWVGRGPSGFSPLWDGWIYNSVLFAGCVACGCRAAVSPSSRRASAMFAIGIGAWFLGNVTWTIWLQGLADPPYPSWADAGYLLFYPPVTAAVLITAGRAAGRWRNPVVLIDGLIGGFSGAAVVAVFALGPIAASVTGTRSAILTNLAYPVADLLLLSLLLTVAGLSGWRLSRRQIVIMVSLAMFAVADSVYLLRIATDSYVSGTVLDAGWMVALVGLTWAQWIDDDGATRARPAHGRAVWVPVSLVAAALLVCGWYAVRELPVVASIAIGCALLCTGARMVVTLKEMERLGASERSAREARIEALAQARDEIEQANEALEQRVQERTADLEASNTRLLATAERLRQSNRELQDFAYVASHDLQEPLRKVQAFGSRLENRYQEVLDDAGRDYLSRMQGAAGRMSTLIDDLLTFSRVSTRAHMMEKVDLVQVARDAVSDLEIALEQTGGSVQFSALPSIEADPTQMRQLIQNLVANAIKFHRDGVAPIVTITADLIETPASESAALGPFCRLQVSDNGIGFDERYLDRIFTVFQRLHGRTEYAGSGIGLSVCRRIVERHRGEITATSVPGAGSVFTVLLPVHQPEEIES